MNPIPSNAPPMADHHQAPGGSITYLVFCALASALGGLLFGYDLFVI